MLTLTQLLEKAHTLRASDVHLVCGLPPKCRIDGAVTDLTEDAPTAADEAYHNDHQAAFMAARQRVLDDQAARQAQADDEPKEQQVRRIIRDEHTVPMCMAHILRQVRKAPARFETLLSPSPTREEVVTLFLAMLELLKLGKITFFQDGIYGDISVSCA